MLRVLQAGGGWNTSIFGTTTKPNAPAVPQTVPSGSYTLMSFVPGSPRFQFDVTLAPGSTTNIVLYIQFGGACGGEPMQGPVKF